MRFGAPVFDVFAGWAADPGDRRSEGPGAGQVKDPIVRELVAKILESSRLKPRYGEHVAAVRKALDASAPPRRDPRSFVGRTRGRGKRSR